MSTVTVDPQSGARRLIEASGVIKPSMARNFGGQRKDA